LKFLKVSVCPGRLPAAGAVFLSGKKFLIFFKSLSQFGVVTLLNEVAAIGEAAFYMVAVDLKHNFVFRFLHSRTAGKYKL
jgi:hypothetical protein